MKRKKIEKVLGDARMEVTTSVHGEPILGIAINGEFITIPYNNVETERPTAGLNSQQARLLKVAQQLADKTARDAINSSCLAVQAQFGIDSGDLAGVFYSGDMSTMIHKIIAEYVAAECNSPGGFLPLE